MIFGRDQVLETLKDHGEQALVNIGSAKFGVAIRGHDRHMAVGDRQDGRVERAATEVIDKHGAITRLDETVVDRGCHRLVNELDDTDAGDAPSLSRRLPLARAEVGWDGDDGRGA